MRIDSDVNVLGKEDSGARQVSRSVRGVSGGKSGTVRGPGGDERRGEPSTVVGRSDTVKSREVLPDSLLPEEAGGKEHQGLVFDCLGEVKL